MDRETWLPLLGLIGLAVAGGVMLYATSGGPTPEEQGVRVPPGKAEAEPLRLLHQTEVGERAWPAPDSPNVVVLTACSLRRDAVAPYGGSAELTPRMGELAADGVVLDDALAAGVWTRESMAAMFTGMHALDLGLVEPGPRASERALGQDETRTVAEAMADAGWWTVAVNASPSATRPRSGLWQGFDYVRDAHPEGFKAQHRLTAVHAAQQAIRMMNERPMDRPFYLQLLVTDSHKPLRVPPAEAEPWEELPNPHYMATVRRVDDALGFLLDWLDTQGLAENTYVILVADHGEGLTRPEHHGPAHGRYVAASAARVPWIVRGPGIPEGRTVEGLASGVDFAPTLLGLVGVEEGLAEGLPGRDLSQALRTGAPTGRTRAITDTWYRNANRAAIWTPEATCQKDFGSTGLEDDGFVDGCFDRVADPESTRPIDRPELLAELETWRAERAVPEPAAPPKKPRKKDKSGGPDGAP